MLWFQNLNAMLLMGKQSESELAEHLYELIGELFSIVPTAIMAVLPQLEFKLKVKKILALLQRM